MTLTMLNQQQWHPRTERTQIIERNDDSVDDDGNGNDDDDSNQ